MTATDARTEATTPQAVDAPRMRVDWNAPEIVVPQTTRVLVVASGHQFSTKDVYDSAVNGFKAAGCEVVGYPFHDYLSDMMDLVEDWKERGIPSPTQRLIDRAASPVFKRALAFRPDLIFFITGYVFPQADALLLGQYARTAVWLTEGPYQWESEFVAQGDFKHAFTNERKCVERFRAERRAAGHPHPENVHYLPHAYDPDRHYPREADPALRSDVCFVGSPFPERQALFGAADFRDLKVVARGLWTELEMESILDPQTGLIENAKAHDLYAAAAVNVNHHRLSRYYGDGRQIEDGEAESLNLRAYELAAAGCFQVCDDSRPELLEVFGDAVPTYRHRDGKDLERVVRYWLARPEERAEKAAEAQERVHAHTVQARIETVLSIVFDKE